MDEAEQDQDSTYTHTPLDASKKDIRLLQLLPVKDNNVAHSGVRCNIVHASLDDSPAYEALSYV